MDANSQTPYATGQVTGRDEPALSPTNASANSNLVHPQPFRVEKKCQRLLNIGEDEIKDENNKLVGALCFQMPFK